MLSNFGIDSGGLSLVTNLLVLFLIVTYLALIYWTYLDAKRRIEDPVLIACATAASVFPFVGTIIYTILRPPEFLADREERELELRAAELRLRQLIDQACPHCEYPIERDYLRCPNCERRLRNPCRKCTRALDPKWGVCPYCETEVRRRRERSEGERSRAARARAARSGRPQRSSADQPRSASGSSEGRDGPSRRERERDPVAQGSRQQRSPEGRSGRSEAEPR